MTHSNYGNVLLFKCDRTGFLCKRVYKYYASAGEETRIPLTYDSAINQLKFGGEKSMLYRRSQTKTLCASTPSDITLVPPPLAAATPQREHKACSDERK